MPNVFDTANYILERSGSMSAMKLQCLCYYAQAYSLALADAPLFDEDFQAWENGPVCKELYYHADDKRNIGVSNLTDEQKKIIDQILNCYGELDDQWLGMFATSEKPWIDAKNGIIEKDSIRDYYCELFRISDLIGRSGFPYWVQFPLLGSVEEDE